MSGKPLRSTLGATLAMVIATPAVLGLETLARALFLPAWADEIRQELRPTLTPIAWVLLALTVLTVPLSVAAQRGMERRLLAKVDAYGGGEGKRAEARFEAVFVAASIPQIPAILATLLLSFGAEALPALLAVLLSVGAVVLLSIRSRGAAPRSRGAAPPASS
ncbi:MAG: hypothetical protein R3F14_43550 [Polyangiaceae bacterium]